MTDVTRISVTASVELALKRLKKAEIGVYDCKKDGARFIFSVKDKHVKKVFAIFAKPCYNIAVVGKSGRTRLFARALNRAGLIVGAAAFAAIAAISNSFVFKISVGGSGSYLSPEVKRIVYEAGAKEFSLCTNFDIPVATGKILALPRVTFCNIEKRGSIIHVDVQVNEEHNAAIDSSPLVCDVNGTVRTIVAICGTATVAEGNKVKAGDTLIAPYTLAGETQTKSLAAGYAEIECRGRKEYFADAETDENLKAAYASILLDAAEILTRSHTVKETDGGVVYVIDFTYLHKLSINIG